QKSSLPYVNPNGADYFPLTAIFAICLGFPSAGDHKRGQTYLALLATVNSMWVFLSGSRGGILIAVCCLLFLTLRTQSLSRRITYLIAAALLGFLVSTQFTDLQATALKRLNLLFDDSKASIGER